MSFINALAQFVSGASPALRCLAEFNKLLRVFFQPAGINMLGNCGYIRHKNPIKKPAEAGNS
jgi:hypothetical protein